MTYPVALYPGCPCYRCDSTTWEPFYRDHGLFERMSLCPQCGNKRCPGAMDHTLHQEAAALSPEPRSRPHKLPLPWVTAEVVAWKCAACDKWCNDSRRDGECPVDWRAAGRSDGFGASGTDGNQS